MATKRISPKKKPAAKKPAAKKPAAPRALKFAPLGPVQEVTLREAGEAPSLVFRAPPSTTPVGVALEGHREYVQALAFSPDGETLVTGSEDATMRVWRVATRECLRTLTDHARAVNCVCFMPDGETLVSASDDGTLKVWNTATWEVVRTLGDGPAYVSEVHPAGEGRVVTAGNDGLVRLWDLSAGVCLRVMHHGSWVNALDASPDGRFAVASSSDNVLRVWDLSTGEVARTLVDASSLHVGDVMGLIVSGENRGVGHSSFARHVVFAPDGETFFTSSQELIAWDASTGVERYRVEGNGWAMEGFALVPGRREVVVASYDAVHLYDLDAKKLLAEAAWDHGGSTHMAAVSPDGRLFACGSQDGPVGLFDLDALRAAGAAPRHVSVVYSDAASPDGAFALTGGSDRTARLWNLATGESRAFNFREGLFVSPVLFTPDGRFALAMNDKATLAVLDARSGALVRTLRSAEADRYRPFSQVRTLRDGRLLVGSADGPLTLWTLDGSRETPESFDDDAGQVVALDVDPDEQVAITSRYANGLVDVSAWNLPARSLRWRLQRPMKKGYVCGVKIVEARAVLTTSEGGLLVVVLHDGTLLHALELARDEFATSMVVTGPEEVVVLGEGPARVDLARGAVVARIASETDHYYVALDGERRALRVSNDGVAEVDLVAGTITPACSLGPMTQVTPTPGTAFVAVGPKAPEFAGTVAVLRRASRDEYRVASPKLPHLEAPRASKKAAAKKKKKPAAKKKAATRSR